MEIASETALCMVCGGLCRASARTPSRYARPVPRFELRVRHRQLDRPMRRMALDLDAVCVVDRHEERQRVAGRQRRGRPAATPARGSCRRPPSRRPAPALDPARRRRRAGPRSVAVSRPASCRTENRTPAGLRNFSDELAARRPAGRSTGSRGVEPHVETRRGRTRTGPASRSPAAGRSGASRRRRRGPRASRRRATRSSWFPRRRASASASAVGAVWTGGAPRRRDVADEQLVGDRLLQQPVGVPEVPAEQVVELEVVRRRMVVAVPPEPVAAFGDQHLLARPARAPPASTCAGALSSASRASAS